MSQGENISYTQHILEELPRTMSIGAAQYTSIMLSSTMLEVTDIHDPGPLTLYGREAAALYWPGGHPQHGYKFEIVGLQDPEPPDKAQARAELRAAILGATIGATALQRVLPIIRQSWRNLEQQAAPRSPLSVAMEWCDSYALPLTICEFGKVVRSQRAPQGATVMHLWYPISVAPQPVLEQLQEVVRDTMDQPPRT